MTYFPPCCDLDPDSIRDICKGCDQVMVYGNRSCKYITVKQILDNWARWGKNPPVKKTFNWAVSFDSASKAARTTCEGRDMNQIAYRSNQYRPWKYSRPCKTTLTDLVLENYKRIEEGKKIIACLFCIEIEGLDDKFTMKHIASRKKKWNDQITCKELRRAYKLCTHPNPKVRNAAEKTFKFVRLNYVGRETYSLKLLPAPWAEAKEAAALWEQRQKNPTHISEKPKEVNWKKQLDERVAEYDKTLVRTPPPILMPSIPVMATAMAAMAIREAAKAVARA